MSRHSSLVLSASFIACLLTAFVAKSVLGQSAGAPPQMAPVEQYKLYNYSGNKEGTEQDLNRLAADGWHVRTAVAGMIILAK